MEKFVALEEKVIIAKNDNDSLNELISEYRPFIQKVVYETCQHYVEWGKDEELSIGLLAFEEAIKRFDSDKGNFLPLAKMIIRSRVIDYLRKENRHLHVDIDEVKEEFVTDVNPIADEIKELQTYLATYSISFEELPNISPVKKKLREELKYTAKVIIEKENLLQTIVEKKQLPIKAISEEVGISHKKLERNRIYLITMVLIWYLDLPLLQGYIK